MNSNNIHKIISIGEEIKKISKKVAFIMSIVFLTVNTQSCAIHNILGRDQNNSVQWNPVEECVSKDYLNTSVRIEDNLINTLKTKCDIDISKAEIPEDHEINNLQAGNTFDIFIGGDTVTVRLNNDTNYQFTVDDSNKINSKIYKISLDADNVIESEAI